jgi:hypothetical protein
VLLPHVDHVRGSAAVAQPLLLVSLHSDVAVQSDAPPFESRATLAAALPRFQPCDPSTLVSAWYSRAAAAASKSADDGERRRIGRTAVKLWRHLPHADEARYWLEHRVSQRVMTTVPRFAHHRVLAVGSWPGRRSRSDQFRVVRSRARVIFRAAAFSRTSKLENRVAATPALLATSSNDARWMLSKLRRAVPLSQLARGPAQGMAGLQRQNLDHCSSNARFAALICDAVSAPSREVSPERRAFPCTPRPTSR